MSGQLHFTTEAEARQWLDEQGYEGEVSYSPGQFGNYVARQTFKSRPARMLSYVGELGEETEATISRELEAREKERIRKGIPIGKIRTAGGIPIRVTEDAAKAIGQKEEARLIKAQETLARIPQLDAQYKELQRNESYWKFEKDKHTKSLETMKAQVGLHQARPEDLIKTEQELHNAEYNLESVQNQKAGMEKELIELRRQEPKLQEMVVKGGSYSPTVRTAMVAATRLQSATGEFAAGTTKTILSGGLQKPRGERRSPTGGLEAQAKAMTGGGGQPQMRIAGIPQKQPGVIGMERPAIASMGTPQLEPAPQIEETKGFAETASPDKTGMNLDKLRDPRYGKSLSEG